MISNHVDLLDCSVLINLFISVTVEISSMYRDVYNLKEMVITHASAIVVEELT